MRILLVYPCSPDTFWSFKHVLKFVAKRAAFPPLGLLTVAALLPSDWDAPILVLSRADGKPTCVKPRAGAQFIMEYGVLS